MDKKEIQSNDNTFLISQGMPFQFEEAFKTLRANLRYASVDGAVKKMIVTSAIAGEGKTTVAINLAITLSQLSRRVLIIDADLRKPKVHKYLKIGSAKKNGLTLALTGLQTVKESILYLNEYGIFAMPSGPAVPNPTELLQSKTMSSILGELSQNFDYIIIDTPPVSIVSDAAVLSPLSDGVIFVVRQGYSPAGAILSAKSNLENAKAHVLGCVLNVYNAGKSNRYSTSYYYKQYSHYYK
jgi:capsular exopolysaccharide synthesis family protein